MSLEVVNNGSGDVFINKPYVHIVTDNGKGYGFFGWGRGRTKLTHRN
jgi:hypothetical protein